MFTLLSLGIALPAFASGREFSIDGLVDCGRRSGQCCPLGETLDLLTTDSGGAQRYTVVVTWIADQLPSIEQDMLVEVDVQSRPDGLLQAVALRDLSGVSGTTDRGQVTGSRPREPVKEDGNRGPGAGPSATPTGTQTATATPTPPGSLTSTPTGTPTSTAAQAPSSTPTGTATPTSTPAEAPTPSPSATQTPTATRTDTPTPTDTSTPTQAPTATSRDTPTPAVTETPMPTPTALLLTYL